MSLDISNFIRFLTKDIEERLRLIKEELLYYKSIIDYFDKPQNHDKKQESNEQHDSIFNSTEFISKLKQPIDYYMKIYVDIEKSFNYLKERFINSIDKESNNDLSIFFSRYISIKHGLNKIANRMEFIQRKMLSILESFPGYYPSPSETSIKEATKIHVFMDKMAKFIYEFMFYNFSSNKDDGKDFNTYFYWDFNESIDFIPEDEFVIINTDYYLPRRQSYWVILFHEIMHYIVENKKSDFKIARIIEDYSEKLSRTINIGILKLFPGSYQAFKPKELYDVFIDAMLAKALGLPYVLASINYLIFSEDKSLERPEPTRIWPIRLKAIIQASNYSVKSEYKSILKSIEEWIDYVYNLQKYSSLNVYREKVYKLENIFLEATQEFIETFLKNKHVKKITNKIEELFRSNKTENEYSEYLRIYLQYLDKYISNVIEREFKEEKNNNKGDTKQNEFKIDPLCILYTELDCFNKAYSIDKLDLLFSIPTFHFRFFKLRLDNHVNSNEKQKCFINSFENIMYCIGPYTMATFCENSIENKKFNLERTWFKDYYIIPYYYNSRFKYNIKTNPQGYGNTNKEINKCEQSYPSWMKKEDLDNGILIWIDFGINRKNFNEQDKQSIEEYFQQLFEKRLKEIVGDDFRQIFEKRSKEIVRYNKFSKKVYNKYEELDYAIFTSLDWFDFCALIYIKPKKCHNKEECFDLTEFVREIKQRILMDNNCKLTRTETTILIGNKCAEKVILSEPPVFYLRASRYALGNLKNCLDKLKDKNSPINKSMSSGLSMVVYYKLGIWDLMVSFEGSESTSNTGICFDKYIDVFCKLITEVKCAESSDRNKDNNKNKNCYEGNVFSDVQISLNIKA